MPLLPSQSDWSNAASGLGGAVSGAWKGTGIIQDKKYNPYDPDPANFQDPNLGSALAGYQQGIQGAQGQQAPQANPYWQQGNQDLASALWASSQGQGPSLAQGQFNQALGQSLAAQQAAAASGATAGNPALAQRTLSQQQAGMNQAAAGQSGQLRLQEQMQARGMLASVLGQGQQGDLAQGSLDLQNQNQINSMVQFYESLGASREEANRQAQMEMERIKAGAYGQAQGFQYGQNQGNQQTAGGLLGGIIGAGGSAGAAALSDERQKKNINPADRVIQEFLDSIEGKSYEYKDPSMPGAAPGPQVGVMAQQMAATPVGRQAVVQTPNGLGLDPARGLGAALAGLAHLNKKVEAIEPYAATDMSPYAAGKFPGDEGRTRALRDDLSQQSRAGMAREQLPAAAMPPAPEPSSGRRVLDRIMQILGTGSPRGEQQTHQAIGAGPA